MWRDGKQDRHTNTRYSGQHFCRAGPLLLREQGVIDMNDAMRNVKQRSTPVWGGYGFANNFTSRGLALSFFA